MKRRSFDSEFAKHKVHISGDKTKLGCNRWKQSWVRALCQAIFHRKPWTLRGTMEYQMVEWWNRVGGGEDKAETKEETEKSPLEERDKSTVLGLEGLE